MLGCRRPNVVVFASGSRERGKRLPDHNAHIAVVSIGDRDGMGILQELCLSDSAAAPASGREVRERQSVTCLLFHEDDR